MGACTDFRLPNKISFPVTILRIGDQIIIISWHGMQPFVNILLAESSTSLIFGRPESKQHVHAILLCINAYNSSAKFIGGGVFITSLREVNHMRTTTCINVN